MSTHAPSVTASVLAGSRFRLIGPHRGGRVVAVAGDPRHAQTFYFGSTGGGIWKSSNAGLTWENVSDGYFRRASVGAIAVAGSDPNVIYAGMGEATIRGNVSHGDGVYRSTDAGKTWLHLGLADTQTIGRVRVHPHDPDTVYVAALGHVFGTNAERGVYRSRDGGTSWQQVLFRSDRAGAVDLCLNPANPRELYAAFWEAQRTPWSLTSGGPGSSLYKSTDGGDTWTELTTRPGLPKGVLGRIGVAVSPVKPERVWAMVEAQEGGLFRSDDGGASWQRVNEDRNLRQRAWYYSHVIADPQSAEVCYVLNVQMWRSSDGGKSFSAMATPHGDNHDLWIDPHNPLHMIEGNDGGACVSFDGGLSWSSLDNQPTAEMYHVTTDTRFPYRVYGDQQDNSTISLPCRSEGAAITQAEWYTVGGGESGYVAVRPDNPDIVYAGNYGGLITRYDHASRQARQITAWPDNPMGSAAADLKYRFQWTFPILISPHDPRLLYIAGNRVFRSDCEGERWEIISPDLTRADPATLGPSGGPITRDNTSVEYYGTIFSLAESPCQAGLLWAGSDDGLIHLSRNGGASWENVTPPNLPEQALISIIEPSWFDSATAYVAATRYKLDDFTPYLLKTCDYGQTWTRITEGLPENEFTRVIREDPACRGLLYAGTEAGLYLSLDAGAHWQRLQGNLPVVPIHDLMVKGSDLVVATHGRSFWILDDLTPLRELAQGEVQPVHLFAPRCAIKLRGTERSGTPGGDHPTAYGRGHGGLVTTLRVVKEPDGTVRTIPLDAGENPPAGVVVQYHLPEGPAQAVVLTFLDGQGREIRRFSSQSEVTGEPKVPARAGLNRFVWNTRYPDAVKVEGAVLWAGSVAGPAALPGEYRVRLEVGEQVREAGFRIDLDPRVHVEAAALEAQFALLLRIRDKLSEVHQAVNRIRAVKEAAAEWVKRTATSQAAEAIKQSAEALITQLRAVEEELIQVKAKSNQDVLNYPIKLNNKLAALAGSVASADAAPTAQAYLVMEELAAQADRQLARLAEIIAVQVPALNDLIAESGMPAIGLDEHGLESGAR